MAADPTWRLLLVGDGPLARTCPPAGRAAGLADRAELTGAVAPADVGSHLHRMDVACAPYPAGGSDYFSPLKVYEYLAAGLPVVASAVGQIPAALDHGRLGRLVPTGRRRTPSPPRWPPCAPTRPSSALAGVRAARRCRPGTPGAPSSSGCSPTARGARAA